MAKIIKINRGSRMYPEETEEVINVAATVGVGGVNLQEDVIVVQALLKFALEEVPDFREVSFPEPTGGDVNATAQIIKKFQRYTNRINPQAVSIDGRIDPINGDKYAPGTRKFWTLYSLQSRALETALLSGHDYPIKAVCKRWSAVKAVLENGVGSLNLGLE